MYAGSDLEFAWRRRVRFGESSARHECACARRRRGSSRSVDRRRARHSVLEKVDIRSGVPAAAFSAAVRTARRTTVLLKFLWPCIYVMVFLWLLYIQHILLFVSNIAVYDYVTHTPGNSASSMRARAARMPAVCFATCYLRCVPTCSRRRHCRWAQRLRRRRPRQRRLLRWPLCHHRLLKPAAARLRLPRLLMLCRALLPRRRRRLLMLLSFRHLCLRRPPLPLPLPLPLAPVPVPPPPVCPSPFSRSFCRVPTHAGSSARRRTSMCPIRGAPRRYSISKDGKIRQSMCGIQSKRLFC
jgi:hypothetical protein